ncbi:MAG: Phosphopantothenoylcysteine synthetase/decarboxylase [Verrucomicrobiota bacterium]|jgi:phosphopantothenoylcysteine decarboxylase/phosphopantothenate--cysteine ligase
MNFIVTAGPTIEKLDMVRRLTNFSTGRTGTEMANFLAGRGHQVTLLVGEQATWNGNRRAQKVITFSTTTDLQDKLKSLSKNPVNAVFHMAAVGDFMFGKVWKRDANGQMEEVASDKFSTRDGTLLAELVPTPKLIAQLGDLFPKSQVVGWKYEVEGKREDALVAAQLLLDEAKISACVANGPAYGDGFGMVSPTGQRHFAGSAGLFSALEDFVARKSAKA